MKKEAKKGIILGALITASVTCLAAAANAHHSFAQYDPSESVTIEGTVIEYGWVSPHAWVKLAVKDENGQIVEWTLELESLGQIYRRGWRPDTFKPGDTATFDIAPMRNGMPGGGVRTATLSDGTTLFSRNLE